jgi:hypothetical protein
MPTPLEALNYAKRFTGNLPVDDSTMKYRILNYAHNRLWSAAPWSWSVESIPVVTLANSTQDYTPSPAITDCFGLVKVTLRVDEEQHDLEVTAALPETTTDITGKPSQVAWTSDDTLRVLPVPVGYSTMPKLYGWYKKDVTPIAVGNEGTDYTTLCGCPAEWFWVFEELVLLRALAFAHSPRTGAVVSNGGQTQHSGQFGVVESAIATMKMAEDKFLTSLGREVGNG